MKIDNCVMDPKKNWASLFSLKGNAKRTFVHYYCALFSPQTNLVDNNWYNIRKELSRARGLSCGICKGNGATLGCFEKRCNIRAHIPCNMKEKVSS